MAGVEAIETLVSEWLSKYGAYGTFLIPLFAFGETCFGVGLFVSALWLVVICTALFQGGYAELHMMFLLAFAGAACGDHAGFFLGQHWGPNFHHLRIVRKNRRRVAQAEAMVRKLGPYAIFIGRFIPAVRCLMPALLGMSGFPRARYTPLELMASALWASALCGIVFGISTWAIA